MQGQNRKDKSNKQICLIFQEAIPTCKYFQLAMDPYEQGSRRKAGTMKGKEKVGDQGKLTRNQAYQSNIEEVSTFNITFPCNFL